jgi:uncharacterized oligopeptide transporter (OPT) family protein
MNRYVVPSVAAGTLASIFLLVALDAPAFWWSAFFITMAVLVALLALRVRQ